MTTQLSQLTVRLRARLNRLRTDQKEQGRLPRQLPRARVALRLLERECRLLDREDAAAWLSTLDELLCWLEEHPRRAGQSFEPDLTRLVAWAEQAMDDFDGGATPADAIRTPELADLQEHLLVAVQPPPPPFLEQPEPPGGPPAIAEKPPRILLLLTPALWSRSLDDRLRDGGYLPERACSATDLQERLGAEGPAAAILCDNVRPARHLETVCSLLGPERLRRAPPLILVVAREARSLTDLAHRLGAAGIWGFPFLFSSLRGLLAGPPPV
jgi:hypothetical protein